jgi:hypothetical protein
VCWYKTLYQVELVVWTSITTSRDKVVMRLVHTTGKTWYKVLYQRTMYVISLSNISIKTNFKQITRVELKFVQYSQGDYILCMTSRYFFHSFTNVRLLCFVSHSNDMMSCQSNSAENVSCKIVPFFYHHSGDTTSCIRQVTFVNFKGKCT